MSITVKTCFEPSCDGCGEEIWTHCDGVPHYESRDQAQRNLDFQHWMLLADGRTFCPDCDYPEDAPRLRLPSEPTDTEATS